MNWLRQHSRAWATGWLLVQVLSFATLLPRDCCAAHRGHGARQAHATGQDASEAACHDAHTPPPPQPDCSLRGMCDGPTLALPMSTAIATVPPGAFAVAPDPVPTAAPAIAHTAILAADAIPESPPPRA